MHVLFLVYIKSSDWMLRACGGDSCRSWIHRTHHRTRSLEFYRDEEAQALSARAHCAQRSSSRRCGKESQDANNDGKWQTTRIDHDAPGTSKKAHKFNTEHCFRVRTNPQFQERVGKQASRDVMALARLLRAQTRTEAKTSLLGVPMLLAALTFRTYRGALA